MVSDGRERLRSNPYPGRGIILGLDATGRYALQIYWITARSAGSKNRILAIEGEDVRTQPFDPAERSGDPNIWYRAMARDGDRHVVSNGVQTDVIVELLRQEQTFADAALTLTHEMDKPNFTPRISGLTDLSERVIAMSFAMASRGHDGSPRRTIFGYRPAPGSGRCFHTYAADGNPVPAYRGRPYEIELPGTPQQAAAGVWEELLPRDRRVAMALKAIDVETRAVATLQVTNELA